MELTGVYASNQLLLLLFFLKIFLEKKTADIFAVIGDIWKETMLGDCAMGCRKFMKWNLSRNCCKQRNQGSWGKF